MKTCYPFNGDFEYRPTKLQFSFRSTKLLITSPTTPRKNYTSQRLQHSEKNTEPNESVGSSDQTEGVGSRSFTHKRENCRDPRVAHQSVDNITRTHPQHANPPHQHYWEGHKSDQCYQHNKYATFYDRNP